MYFYWLLSDSFIKNHPVTRDVSLTDTLLNTDSHIQADWCHGGCVTPQSCFLWNTLRQMPNMWAPGRISAVQAPTHLSESDLWLISSRQTLLHRGPPPINSPFSPFKKQHYITWWGAFVKSWIPQAWNRTLHKHAPRQSRPFVEVEQDEEIKQRSIYRAARSGRGFVWHHRRFMMLTKCFQGSKLLIFQISLSKRLLI